MLQLFYDSRHLCDHLKRSQFCLSSPDLGSETWAGAWPNMGSFILGISYQSTIYTHTRWDDGLDSDHNKDMGAD